MTRSVTSDLEKLAHGRTVSKEAFLALLTDTQSRKVLEQIARLRALFEPPLGEESAPALPVTWEELAGYADGTLADPDRQHAVRQFLRQQAPDLLPDDEKSDTIIDLRYQADTWIGPPTRPKPPTNHGE